MNRCIVPLSILIHRVINGCSLIDRRSCGSSIFLKACIGGVFIGEPFHLIGELRIDIVLKASFVVFEHSNVKINYQISNHSCLILHKIMYRLFFPCIISPNFNIDRNPYLLYLMRKLFIYWKSVSLPIKELKYGICL